MTTAQPATTLPATLTAVTADPPGGPDTLKLVERPMPAPGRDEVLIAVAAAGVNRPDLLQRQGAYPPPPGAPDTLGLEVAGTIVAVGPQVGRWKVGDAVCALVAGGGYATHAIAPAGQCLPIPSGLSAVEAAGLPETFFTVWSNVIERGRLGHGESLLVHGGASGIGVTAVQLAAALGHTVYATAGGAARCRAVEALGARRAIDYRSEDFVEVLKAETGGRGVDVILDMVGGSYVARNMKAAAPDGRIVSIAFLEGSKVEIDLMPMMLKRLTLTGSTLRARPVAFKAAIASRLEERVWPLIEAGRIRPVVEATFPLAQVADAHRHLEAGAHVGKVVLVTAG